MINNEDSTTPEGTEPSDENTEQPAAETAVAEADTTADEPSDGGSDLDGEHRMSLEVEVSDSGPCLKHVVVKVSRSDLDHINGTAINELVDSAEVPGFRKGRVPRGLIGKRFRKQLADEVKQKVLISSLEQIADDHDLDPINEPNIDVDSIDIPEEGDFEYEFDVEVRPDFELPEYHGLKIERPTHEVSDEDAENHLQQFLLQYAHLHDHEGAAQIGDAVVADLSIAHEGEVIKTLSEEVLNLWPVLRFQDAELEGFDTLLDGAAVGDERQAELTVSTEADAVALRGETISLTIHVNAVKQLHTPELNEEFLTRLGVGDEAELREALKDSLERQVEFRQRQATREQVLAQITESADWELPEELVAKQTENALRREILEMQQAGFTTQDIQARENEIRQHAISTTRQAMKEHFVLDRIAETEEIEIASADLETEIQLMAAQAGESPRRLRARLIKSGMIENLEAQVRERKAIDVILEHAEFKDVEGEPLVAGLVATVNQSVCQTIPETIATDAPAATEPEAADADANETGEEPGEDDGDD